MKSIVIFVCTLVFLLEHVATEKEKCFDADKILEYHGKEIGGSSDNGQSKSKESSEEESSRRIRRQDESNEVVLEDVLESAATDDENDDALYEHTERYEEVMQYLRFVTLPEKQDFVLLTTAKCWIEHVGLKETAVGSEVRKLSQCFEDDILSFCENPFENKPEMFFF